MKKYMFILVDIRKILFLYIDYAKTKNIPGRCCQMGATNLLFKCGMGRAALWDSATTLPEFSTFVVLVPDGAGTTFEAPLELDDFAPFFESISSKYVVKSSVSSSFCSAIGDAHPPVGNLFSGGLELKAWSHRAFVSVFLKMRLRTPPASAFFTTTALAPGVGPKYVNNCFTKSLPYILLLARVVEWYRSMYGSPPRGILMMRSVSDHVLAITTWSPKIFLMRYGAFFFL